MHYSGWRAIVGAAMLVTATPVLAQRSLTEPADANERAVLPELGAALGSGHPDKPRLDALLARLPRPTPRRGVVQLGPAALLAQSDHYADAVPLAEEASRLLPNSPLPKLILCELLTFTGAPQRAADLWLEASRQAPEVARESDSYSLSALIGRLNDMGDSTRARTVAARMGEIGVAHLLAPDRVDAAAAQLTLLADRGDVEGARRGLADVERPSKLRAFYVDKRYQALWPAIEAQAGANLGIAHRHWFTVVRDEWQRGRDFETATTYARLLASVGEYAAVMRLFGPLLANGKVHLDDPNIWFLAPVVARATAETGRQPEARALLQRLNTAPTADVTMRLNASGNLANLSYLSQRWEDVVSETASWLRIAKDLGPAVNTSAVLQVSGLRACALSRLGRANEAAPLIGDVLLAQRATPEPALKLLLCQHDLPKSRALLIDRLADEDSRGWALGIVQPDNERSTLPEQQVEAKLLNQLRSDPAVQAALAKVGRIMPTPLTSSMPTGFDPDVTARPGRPDSV